MPDPVADAAAFDRLYQMLVEAHRDLSPDASRRLDARLVLLLAERVGDVEVVRRTIRAALQAEPGAGPAGEDRTVAWRPPPAGASGSDG